MTNFIRHKKASLKYQKVSCFEAGIKLLGHEVKSIKSSQGSLEGSYVVVRGGEAFILGLTIPAWQPNNTINQYEVDRTRKLLLTRSQISELAEADSKKGLGIIPFSMYNKHGLIKVEICITKNKTTRDRREDIKKRDSQRDLDRTLKY